MLEKFCHAGRHYVSENHIKKRKNRKDACESCLSKMKERRKVSK